VAVSAQFVKIVSVVRQRFSVALFTMLAFAHAQIAHVGLAESESLRTTTSSAPALMSAVDGSLECGLSQDFHQHVGTGPVTPDSALLFSRTRMAFKDLMPAASVLPTAMHALRGKDGEVCGDVRRVLVALTRCYLENLWSWAPLALKINDRTCGQPRPVNIKYVNYMLGENAKLLTKHSLAPALVQMWFCLHVVSFESNVAGASECLGLEVLRFHQACN